jgi:hypothetical protein
VARISDAIRMDDQCVRCVFAKAFIDGAES